jgi:hypothetical protein
MNNPLTDYPLLGTGKKEKNQNVLFPSDGLNFLITYQYGRIIRRNEKPKSFSAPLCLTEEKKDLPHG